MVSTTVKEITEAGVIVTKNGEEQLLSGLDRVILACGTKSVDSLSNSIKDTVSEVYVIGDAKEPRKALEAIAEGSEVARAI